MTDKDFINEYFNNDIPEKVDGYTLAKIMIKYGIYKQKLYKTEKQLTFILCKVFGVFEIEEFVEECKHIINQVLEMENQYYVLFYCR